MRRLENSAKRRCTSWTSSFFRKQLLSWCEAEGYKLLRELDLPGVRAFRSSWKGGALAKKKKQERLTGFFWFCIRAGWITTNPTHNLGRISVTQAPTDYFTREEFDKLIDSTHLYRESRSDDSIGGNNATRLRTLILLMRWSGLRIRDAITLERTRLIGDNLLLYQAKTGTPVYVPLPPQVAQASRDVPASSKPNPRYFFWSGNGLPKTAVADWQRSFRRPFTLAGLEKPHGTTKRCFPHMLRDTSAVEMLLAGVPIDQVSMLLGHSSVKITEKHYSPWVKARQEQLASSVRNAWGVLGAAPPQPTKKKAKLLKMALNQHSTGTISAEETSFNDLRTRPSVLVGAFNNAWTLKLTSQLRYHFEIDQEERRMWIADSAQPAMKAWSFQCVQTGLDL